MFIHPRMVKNIHPWAAGLLEACSCRVATQDFRSSLGQPTNPMHVTGGIWWATRDTSGEGSSLLGQPQVRKASMTNPAKDFIFWLQKCRFGCQLGPDLQLWYQSSSSPKNYSHLRSSEFSAGCQTTLCQKVCFSQDFWCLQQRSHGIHQNTGGLAVAAKNEGSWPTNYQETKLVRQSFGYHRRIVAIANSGCAPTKNWIQSK